MLGQTYRIRAYNTQNQAITVVVDWQAWKFASGALSYGTAQTDTFTSMAASTGTDVTATQDNSTDLYLGMDIWASFTAGTTTDGTGTVALYLEIAPDGTNFPDSDKGIFIGAYTVTAADTTTTKAKNFQIG